MIMGRFNSFFMEANKAKGKPESNNSEIKKSEHTNDAENSINNFGEQSLPQQFPVSNVSTKTNTENISADFDMNSNTSDSTDAQETDGSKREYLKLNVNEIEFAEDNPFRKNDKTEFGQEELEELANNIAVFGLLHPLLVNKVNSHFVLISGERRLQAVRMLGWTEVDCIVTEVNNPMLEKGMLRSANTEIRRTIKPFEMFGYIYELLHIFENMSSNPTSGKEKKDKYQYIAKSLSISKRQLFKYTSIMNNLDKLSDEERNMLENGELSINRAYEIVKHSKDNDIKKNSESFNTADSQEEHIDDNSSTTNDMNSIEESVTKPTSEKDETLYDSDDYSKEIEATALDTQEDENTAAINSEEIDTVTDAEETVEKNTDEAENEKEVAAIAENDMSLSANDEFLSALLNFSGNKKAPLYKGISKSTGRMIFGWLFYANDKAYIVFPSKTFKAYQIEDTVVDINFTCYEVEKESIKRRR